MTIEHAIFQDELIFTSQRGTFDIQSESSEKVFQGHTNAITCLAKLGRSGLVSGSWDKTVKIWSVKTGQCVRSIPVPDVPEVIHTNKSTVIAIGYGPTVLLYDMKENRVVAKLQGHSDSVVGISSSINGKIYVTVSDDRSFRVWHNARCRWIRTVLEDPTTIICTPKVSTIFVGLEIRSSPYKGLIQIFDVKSNKQIGKISTTTAPSFLEGKGKHIIVGTLDGSVLVCNLSGEIIQEFSFDGRIIAAQINESIGTAVTPSGVQRTNLNVL